MYIIKKKKEIKLDYIANDFVAIYEAEYPDVMCAGLPGIAVLKTGRIVVNLEVSSAKEGLIDGERAILPASEIQGRIYTSDDRGRTWQRRVNYPFYHSRPFVAGDSVYVIGHNKDLYIMRSDDDGVTWTEPVKLTEGQFWHQAPCNVHHANGNVYLVMEKKAHDDVLGWQVSVLAPILMRGKIGDDLTKRENWTFATELCFRDAVDQNDLDYHGIPCYSTPPNSYAEISPGRACGAMGWLETNVVQFTDQNHYLYDPEGRTFHLWMRAHTGRTGYACIAKVHETSYGDMVTMLEQAPSGKKMVFVPCPGGQMKFHIVYDEKTELYWLLNTQATDSMTRSEKLPENRYNLPDNERHRLQLHFSKNCFDWCFAGMVAKGESAKESRHYAAMDIHGEDLVIVSRSGDEKAQSAHNGNIITFHKVKNFRNLVY